MSWFDDEIAAEDTVDYVPSYDWGAEADASDDSWIAAIYADPSRALDTVTTPEQADNVVASVLSKFGETAANAVKSILFKPGTRDLNLAGLGTAGAAIYGLMGGNQVQTGGYNKPIPKLTATRAQVPYAADPNRRPGEAGRSYFTDTQYTNPADAPAAQAAATTQAQGIAAAVPTRAAQVNPYEGKYTPAWNPPAQPATNAATTQAAPASGVAQLLPVPQAQGFKPMAAGGGLAAGGFVVPADVVAHLGNGSSSSGLALLAEKLNAKPIKGDGDGMSDSIPTHIDGKEKALVANDEAYISPEMVAKIGGGDGKAGSEKLYAMMEKIRKARTGNPEQGKQINAEKFVPGGIAQLAGGGTIHRFNLGGTAPTTATPPLSTSTATPLGTSTSSSLSPWAGDYVTNYLGKGQALAEAPYQSFQGPLTAGASGLQQQAFAGIGAAAQEGYKPTTYQGGTFGAQEAQQYMNPYLSAALNPQLDEMRRQAQITRVGDAGRLTQAGAFGGSRQAIMESEGNRNLLEKQGQAIGTGYQTAYDKAMQQFNTEQDRRMGAEKATEASRQYSADYGLKSLGEAASLGAVQRGIEGEGIAADKQQFEEQRDYPLKMVQYQKDLLQGLPITSAATTANTTGVSQIASQISGLQGLYELLAGLGQTPAAKTT
jgi:hypothetical protein